MLQLLGEPILFQNDNLHINAECQLRGINSNDAYETFLRDFGEEECSEEWIMLLGVPSLHGIGCWNWGNSHPGWIIILYDPTQGPCSPGLFECEGVSAMRLSDVAAGLLKTGRFR